MREHKFKGKRLDNGEWVYGWLLTNKLGTYIITEENPHECSQYYYIEITEYYRVNPVTIGQFTGLHDKNGREIYEGDIIQWKGADISVAKWEDAKFVVEFIQAYDTEIASNYPCDESEVIGNIHDEPNFFDEDKPCKVSRETCKSCDSCHWARRYDEND